MTEIHPPLRPKPPFVWPEPRILEGMSFYEQQPPFAAVAKSADSVFGIISSFSGKGIVALDNLLKNKDAFRCVLIVAVYPACMTRQHDLESIHQLVEQYKERMKVRISAHRKVTDRPTNGLCFQKKESGTYHIATGPTENFGFDPNDEGKVNFVFKADDVLV